MFQTQKLEICKNEVDNRTIIFLSKDFFWYLWVEKVRQISHFLWCCRLPCEHFHQKI